MTALRKVERDQKAAELSSVNAIIARLTESDFLTRLGLESRRNELEAWLEAEEDEPAETTASAALYFSGAPVAQTQGIQAEFGTLAVNKFQDLVAKMMATENGRLGTRGTVPNKGAATLHITNVLRGSFGFLLEEIEPQGQALDTSLKVAVDNASGLLAAFGEPDEERFRAVVEAIDDRALATARDFFSLMRGAGARFRLIANEEERSFNDQTIALAAERASTTEIKTDREFIPGQLGGILPDAHLFEFRTVTQRGVIKGSVDRSLPASDLARMNREMVDVDTMAILRVQKVIRNGDVAREGFTLLGFGDAKLSATLLPPPNQDGD